MNMNIKIVFACFALLALAACGESKHNLTLEEQRNAENGGIAWSQKADMDFVECSGLDSQADGYVTCTVKDRTSGAVKEILCSYSDGAQGCKLK